MAERLNAVLSRIRALSPREIDLSLGRLSALLADLGRPERRLPPVVHIAGTNGKGSTAAFIRAMAEASGLRVHAFTSPALVRFNEQIRVAGHLIGDEALVPLLERVVATNDGRTLTIFEATVATAYLAFADTPADLAIIEVGMGGRLDATNVIDRPALSLITPIAIDHAEFLGDTIQAIAAHKAGIIKRASPVLLGRQSEAAETVLEREALRVGAPMTLLGRDFDGRLQNGRLVFQDETQLLDLPPPTLVGSHQVDNAALAIAAALRLGLPEAGIEKGLTRVSWPARLQRLRAGPLWDLAKAAGAEIWLDGGHNPNAAAALAQTLATLDRRDPRPLALITGLLASKDAVGFFRAFADLDPHVITTGFAHAGAADPAALAAAAASIGLVAEPHADVVAAMRNALATVGPPARVVICGSLYLAGEVLGLSPETYPN